MRNLLLELKFDGTNYCGWQVQKNGVTVQEALQDAIEKIFGSRLDVTGCSRTDSGVHANSFYVNFRTESSISDDSVVKALNSSLPFDIAVCDCQEVPLDFHARYSAKGKEYVYKIYNQPVRNPFTERYALHCTQPLDIKLMSEAAAFLKGTHDFRAFMAAGSKIEDTIRTVSECTVKTQGNFVVLTISADGFLYNMVRIITGTLLYVSEGKIKPNEMSDIIKACDRSKAGPTVKPHGLYLNRVFY